MSEKLTITYWQEKLKSEEYWNECMVMIHKDKDINEAIKQSFGYLIADTERVERMELREFKSFVSAWAGKMRANGNRERASKNFRL